MPPGTGITMVDGAPMLPGLLIFDCDGVLVDSELIDVRIRSQCFQAEGQVAAPRISGHPAGMRPGRRR